MTEVGEELAGQFLGRFMWLERKLLTSVSRIMSMVGEESTKVSFQDDV